MAFLFLLHALYGAGFIEGRPVQFHVLGIRLVFSGSFTSGLLASQQRVHDTMRLQMQITLSLYHVSLSPMSFITQPTITSLQITAFYKVLN
jgi:hypothetical protein